MTYARLVPLYPGGPRQSSSLGDLLDYVDPFGIHNIPGALADAVDQKTSDVIDQKTQQAVRSATSAASPFVADAQARAQALIAGGVTSADSVIANAEASAGRVLTQVAHAATAVAIGTGVVGAVGVGAYLLLRRRR